MLADKDRYLVVNREIVGVKVAEDVSVRYICRMIETVNVMGAASVR